MEELLVGFEVGQTSQRESGGGVERVYHEEPSEVCLWSHIERGLQQRVCQLHEGAIDEVDVVHESEGIGLHCWWDGTHLDIS